MAFQVRLKFFLGTSHNLVHFLGDWRDWQPLEQAIGPGFCRWINFFVPGFDGEEETFRGSYKGYLQDVSEMVRRLIKDYLQIDQPIIPLGYSGGNIIWRYFQNVNPGLCRGTINFAGPTIIWNPAHFYMYKVFNDFDKLYKLRARPKQLEDLEFRKMLFHKFKYVSMGDYFMYEKVKIWCEDPETLMIWFKKFLSFRDEGWSRFYEIGHS